MLTYNIKPTDGQEKRRVEAGGGEVCYGRISIKIKEEINWLFFLKKFILLFIRKWRSGSFEGIWRYFIQATKLETGFDILCSISLYIYTSISSISHNLQEYS